MRSTKKSLLMSVLSLMLCVAMLLGTTFAWFTDSVTSGKNKIQAGNLDVELYAGETQVTSTTKLFTGVKLWEPGAVAYETLTVKNVGTLALKYQMKLLFDNETKVNGHGLSEVLKVGTFEGKVASDATRETVIGQVASWQALASFEKGGKLQPKTDETPVTYVIYWEPGDNDNTFNMNNENQGKELSIDFGVELNATQLVSESDSFDNTYDAGAPWLGGTDAEGLAENTNDTAKTVKIYTAEQLASFAQSVNSNAKDYEKYTITLESDIDLNNVLWTPISANANHSFVKFDGKGHTIKNLKVEQSTNAGLFGTLSGGDIENLKIDGASIAANDYAGAIIGTTYDSYVKNCEVKNVAVTATPYLKADGSEYDGGAKAGAVVGYLTAQSNVSVENCKVENATIAAYRDLGGLVGYAQGAAKVTGNKINNVSLKYIFAAPYDSKTPNQNMGDYYGRHDAAIIAENNSGTATKGEANLLTTATDLVMLSAAVNNGYTYAGLTVKLDADIDMKDVAFTPIGNVVAYPSDSFAGIFDGQNHTISNLTTVDKTVEYACAGLFGSLHGTVKNVKLTNVDITSSHYAGAVVGYIGEGCNANIENCHVNGGTVTSVPEWKGSEYNNGDKVGGIIGYCVANNSVTGCSVTGLTIKAYRDLGGLAGATAATIRNCTVKDTVIIQSDTNGYKTSVDTYHEFIGRDLGATVYDSSASENVILKREIVDGLIKDGTTYTVSTANGLEAFNQKYIAKQLGSAITLKLDKDIDMTGKTWKPLESVPGNGYMSSISLIDGQNHKISNIKVSGGESALTVGAYGMFYYVDNDLTIKDITIDKAVIDTTNQQVGVLVGLNSGGTVTFDNVKVTNANIKGNSKMGTLVGQIGIEGSTAKTIVNNCTIDGTVIEASKAQVRCGGVAGWVDRLDGTNGSIEFQGDNTVTNLTIKGDDPEALKATAYIYGSYEAENELVNYPAN